MARTLIDNRIIDRELQRLAGYGLVEKYSSYASLNGRRTWTVTLLDGSKRVWEKGGVYAFILGAMGMADVLERGKV